MTIKKFAEINKVKTSTVYEWIKKELIPKANIERNYVPDSARPPYTNARAKNTSAIYASIVKASIKRYHVMPKLYNICSEEFDGYIANLVNANLITIRVTDVITYYDANINASDYDKKFILSAIEACSKGIASGIAEAVLSNR